MPRGQCSINILNVTDDGVITNYATLSVTNITVAGSSTLFTVYPGHAIAPAGVGVVGPLAVTGDLTLRGNTLMDIAKNGATLANDMVSSTGVVDLAAL